MSNSSVQITPVSPSRCVVCGDDDREAIDRALIRRERTQADVARWVKFSHRDADSDSDDPW